MKRAGNAVLSNGITVSLCAIALFAITVRLRQPKHSTLVAGVAAPTGARIDPELFYSLSSTGNRVGPTDASVTLVEFATYSCHACADFWPVLDSVRKRFPDHFAVVVRSFVPQLDRSNAALIVQLAAECAGDQGKFEQFNTVAYLDPGVAQESNGWMALGRSAGVPDSVRFRDCTKSHKYLFRIKADGKAGTELSLPGTPTSFLNGHLIVGAISFRQLASMVAAQLRGPLDY